MTAKNPNPFPDFPVADLLPGAQNHDAFTVVTPAIRRAREIVSDYLDTSTGAGGRSFVIPVRGDYGTGKTHLLGDVATSLRSVQEKEPGVVAAAFLEADPLTWYRNSLGPALARLPLRDLILAAYSAAAQQVAGQAQLTASAVSRLADDGIAARDLVTRELLSPSDVDLTFQALLEDISGDAGAQRTACFVCLVGGP